jgi:phosphoribosylformylglycinamidine synthase
LGKKSPMWSCRLAQTWSEHCKHKIFNARIDYSEEDGKRRRLTVSSRHCKRVTQDKPPSGTGLVCLVFDDNAV